MAERGFSASSTIDAPVDTVWRQLTQWDAAHEWMPGVEGLRLESGSEAPGAMLLFGARGKEQRSEIVAWQPGESLGLKSVQGGITAVYTYRLEPADGGTRLTLDGRCTANGLLWGLVHPLIAWLMARSDRGQVDRLKAVVEG